MDLRRTSQRQTKSRPPIDEVSCDSYESSRSDFVDLQSVPRSATDRGNCQPRTICHFPEIIDVCSMLRCGFLIQSLRTGKPLLVGTPSGLCSGRSFRRNGRLLAYGEIRRNHGLLLDHSIHRTDRPTMAAFNAPAPMLDNRLAVVHAQRKDRTCLHTNPTAGTFGAVYLRWRSSSSHSGLSPRVAFDESCLILNYSFHCHSIVTIGTPEFLDSSG